MEETLKMMKSIIMGYEDKMSIDELIQEYRENKSPNILAYLFVKNYGLLVDLTKLYKLLDTQDIASYVLQEMDKAIFLYDSERHCSFITFFMVCIKNRLRAESQMTQHYIRCANYATEDIDSLIDLEDENFSFDIFNLNDYPLTESEKTQCKLFMDGYSVKEVAIILNYTVQGIYDRNKRIRKKLLDLL